ncbi:hypothetical protein N7495_004771 [Penicillium taxi]|uniref:uncharacterized protein n=1 Tax=Penicillium taxi TaxID=168475 RepID=UPI002544D55F|nr:uncharacterized protein N7495_004771 [Penicillium taxi]KAJ5900027.1 hypothetical protein N7495_004771 [Penicillium taxi]
MSGRFGEIRNDGSQNHDSSIHGENTGLQVAVSHGTINYHYHSPIYALSNITKVLPLQRTYVFRDSITSHKQQLEADQTNLAQKTLTDRSDG